MSSYFKFLDDRRKRTLETRAFYLNPLQNSSSLKFKKNGSKSHVVPCQFKTMHL